ncbi:hypothetical protein PV08_11904 [Exophiala spinifera]|uniref:Uncharacterized protein n=1 Tax=Exophiala spinifera TaxID=91928 RepID=A0A0D2ASU9_9EURO|nr:uncharacterized protein PV08_11904 [Exophiala spinifera]KIW09803.1 hypothetical protein PV08_11904 [Exophiala spinifera]
MDVFDQFFRGRRVTIERNGRYDPARLFYGPRVRLAALAIPDRRGRPPRPPPPRRPIMYDDYDTDYGYDSDSEQVGTIRVNPFSSATDR